MQINLYIQGQQSDNYPRRTFHMMPHSVGGTFHTNSILLKYMTHQYRSFHRNVTPAVNNTSPYMTATHNTTCTENETKRNLTTCTTVCLRENVQHYDAAEPTKTVPVDPAHFKINKVFLTLSQACAAHLTMPDLHWCRKMTKQQQLNNVVVTTVNSDMYTGTNVQLSFTEISPARILHLTKKQLTDLQDKHI